MATYFSACRQFGLNFNECPAKQVGEECGECANLVWILRKKRQNVTKTAENETANEQEKSNDVK